MKIMTRLIQEGSSADEPLNINLSDYSSDEGDTSSCSEDEAVQEMFANPEDCCQPLPVPPPSPVLPRREQHKPPPNKEAAVGDKSPPPSRKILQVHRTVIDLAASDPGSDFCEPPTELESGDENLSWRQVNKKNKNYVETKFLKCGERCNMPPELIVTSAQVAESQITVEVSEKLTVKEETHLSVEQVGADGRVRTQSWHGLRCPPLVRMQSSRSQTAAELSSEVQVKLGANLRQKIWTGVPCNCHGPLEAHWSGRAVTHEALLRSCSKKLAALQRDRGGSRRTPARRSGSESSPDTSPPKSTSLKWRFRRGGVLVAGAMAVSSLPAVVDSASDTEANDKQKNSGKKKKKKRKVVTTARRTKRVQSPRKQAKPLGML